MEAFIDKLLLTDPLKTREQKIELLRNALISDLRKLKDNSQLTRSLLSTLGKSYFFIKDNKLMFSDTNKEISLKSAENIMLKDIELMKGL